MKYKHIFWDWNGTIVNDARPTWETVNAMLSSRGLPQITFEQYCEYVEVPIIRFYEKVMDISKENMESLSKEFNGILKDLIPENPLFSDAVHILKLFKSKGVNQYIFSSSQNKYIEPILKDFGLNHCFTAILGADDCYVGSKAERTKRYMLCNNINPKDALFVGDMVHDSEVADYANADCILVASGHQSFAMLKSTGRKVIHTISELAEYI